MNVQNKIRNVLGIDVRSRHKDQENGNYDPFKNPLIHKRIDGNVIVPPNMSKLWGE
jgi:hypothetical protein